MSEPLVYVDPTDSSRVYVITPEGCFLKEYGNWTRRSLDNEEFEEFQAVPPGSELSASLVSEAKRSSSDMPEA